MASSNLVITGFMGTGKSTVGPLLAERLGRDFIDSDDVIVERAGMTIPEIFAADGEARFRQLEQAVCEGLAARDNLVISTGGGAMLNPAVREAFARTSMVVCLSAQPEVIEARLAQTSGDRPLAGGWRDLWLQRRSVYALLPHQVETSDKSPEQVVEEVFALWQRASV